MKQSFIYLIFFMMIILVFPHSALADDCISGNCLNGFGTMTYYSGDKYVGEFKDNKRSGKGTLILSSGSKYVGEFKNNSPYGYGTKIFSDGTKYVGEFIYGWFNGLGTKTYPDGRVEAGIWKNDKLIKKAGKKVKSLLLK